MAGHKHMLLKFSEKQQVTSVGAKRFLPIVSEDKGPLIFLTCSNKGKTDFILSTQFLRL